MISQILIMNKQGLAAASDSIVTVSPYKTFTGDKKIFQLSEKPPSGIMISGSSSFEGIPFSVLVEKFKQSDNFRNISSIKGTKEAFLDFLGDYTEKHNIDDYVGDVIIEFKKEIVKLINELDEHSFKKYINDAYGYELLDFLKGCNNYNSTFLDIIPSYISKNEFNKVNEAFWRIFSSIFLEIDSEVLIFGYNKNQNFGSYEHFSVIFNNNGFIEGKIIDSVDDVNKPIIKLLAQKEGAESFIYGFDEKFEEYLNELFLINSYDNLDNFLNNLKMEYDFDDRDFKNLKEFTEDYKLSLANMSMIKPIIELKKDFENDILEVVNHLPQPHLCELAKLLIYATYFKQKLSPHMITAGGNIHVVSLTIDEGFQWVG